jgi:hypothetical protein
MFDLTIVVTVTGPAIWEGLRFWTLLRYRRNEGDIADNKAIVSELKSRGNKRQDQPEEGLKGIVGDNKS